MTAGIGIALAFVAMLCWGFGDFMIQKSTRKVGDWETALKRVRSNLTEMAAKDRAA